MRRTSALELLAAFFVVFTAHATSAAADQVCRVYIEPMRTAAMFGSSIPKGSNSVDQRSVAMGREYMLARLAGPGRKFTCLNSATGATHRIATTVSFLRSKENEFKGATYGHSTKTTVWSLDVIVTVSKGVEDVFSKVATGTYEERRPISESQFDNNIFHNLMTSAIEQAADDVIEFFEEPSDGVADAVPSVATAEFPVGARGGSSSCRCCSSCRCGCVSTGRATAAADVRPPLAILKPETGDGVADKEAMMLWDFLESSVSNGAFRLISRSDLARMQEEIGFTTMSDLVNLSSQDRARIGKVKTVSKLLATSVGVFGETRVMSFKVFDASTAEIDTARSRTLRARTLDALLPQISAVMAEIFAAPPSGTVLLPVIHPASMPNKVAAAFDAAMAGVLSQAGVAVKPGTAGAVRIVPLVSAFSVRLVQDGDGFIYRGSISGTVSAEGADAKPVVFSLDDVELGRERGAAPAWLVQRYGEKLVSMVLADAAVRAGLSSFAKLK